MTIAEFAFLFGLLLFAVGYVWFLGVIFFVSVEAGLSYMLLLICCGWLVQFLFDWKNPSQFCAPVLLEITGIALSIIDIGVMN